MRSARGVLDSGAEDSGQDSFLDVVANVVGVLIILVMMVGIQSTHAWITSAAKPSPEKTNRSQQDIAQLRQELKQTTRRVDLSRREVNEMVQRTIAIRHEAAEHHQQRLELAMHRAVIQDDIKNRRSQLDAQNKDEFDVQRQLVESQMHLDELTQEKLTLVSTPTKVEVESVPTPLAKTVDGPAVHLRLRHGLVSIVPFQLLKEEVEYQVARIRRRLQSQDVVEDTFGPIDGYRLKLTLIKARQSGAVGGPIAGQFQRSTIEQLAEFLPNSERLGQHVEQALMPGAALHTLLQKIRRERTPVVVWLYTDSFEEFRILKRTLWENGLSVAIRPLEPGTQIMASSRGTKASAQ